jgi:hypothetical protein
MKEEVKIYLENLQNKLIKNGNKYQAYKKFGSKIIEVGSADTKLIK